MLRIIKGDFSSTAYDDIKKEIRELTEKGEKVFLLVPEQQAVIAEKEMLAELLPSASLFLEVTNFTRLANTVYRELGGLAGEYSTRSKEALIMWKVLTEFSPSLEMTGGREINSGVVEKALAAVSEMKSISATPKLLSEIADSENIKKMHARLAAKLNDIAIIMTEFEKELEKKYTSSRDECDRLAEKLKDPPDSFLGAHFYLSGFTSFTRPQYKVIKQLTSIPMTTVSVYLPYAKRHRDLFEFSELRDTEKKLRSLESLTGIKTVQITKENLKDGRSPYLHELCDLLWRNNVKFSQEALENLPKQLRIFEASDPYEECDFIAADIKRRVMGGDSYRDFAVIARDASKYVGLLDSSLKNADIPFFMSHRKSINSYEAIKLILSLFSIIINGFKRLDVISYAKCKLTGISADACDEFELYCDTWNITNDRFIQDTVWNMSPDGFDKRVRPDDMRLKRINETREHLLAPIVKLKENFENAKTVREYAHALCDFLGESGICLEKRLYKQSDELRERNESEAADITERLWGIICESLNELVEVLGDTNINTEGFFNQLKVVFGEVDIGRIPARYDEVTVGSADIIRLSDKKHVYIIGANTGEFPRLADTGAYFTAKDRRILTEEGYSDFKNDDADIPFARELFFFSRALWSARESATVLYAARSEAFAPLSRSDAVERIIKLSETASKGEDGKDKAVYAIHELKISKLPLEEKLYFPAYALKHSTVDDVKKSLLDSGFSREIELTEKSAVNTEMQLTKEVASTLYPREMPLTQSKIERFADCPFSYFLEYNLRLKDNSEAQIDHLTIGNFVHGVLENFLRSASELNEATRGADTEKTLNDYVCALTDDERHKMVEACAEAYLKEKLDTAMESKRDKTVLERLRKATMPVVDDICDELRSCEFVPTFFEIDIEKSKEEGSDSALPTPVFFKDDQENVSYVKGKIDRVDTYKRGDDVYVRIMDYKTGQMDFHEDDLEKGKHLQMFLYLKAIEDTKNEKFREAIGLGDGGTIIPAGVIYAMTGVNNVTIPTPDQSAEAAAIKKSQGRIGMILDDEDAIDAMNPEYLPVNFKKGRDEKTGKRIPYDSSSKKIYTKEKWKEMCKTMEDTVNRITDRMRSGVISLADKDGGKHCNNCKFKSICRKQ